MLSLIKLDFLANSSTLLAANKDSVSLTKVSVANCSDCKLLIRVNKDCFCASGINLLSLIKLDFLANSSTLLAANKDSVSLTKVSVANCSDCKLLIRVNKDCFCASGINLLSLIKLDFLANSSTLLAANKDSVSLTKVSVANCSDCKLLIRVNKDCFCASGINLLSLIKLDFDFNSFTSLFAISSSVKLTKALVLSISDCKFDILVKIDCF